MKGAQALRPSSVLILILLSAAPSDTSIKYSLSESILNSLEAAIMQRIEHMEPIISGSSGPRYLATKNHGTVNESEATNSIGIIPLKAFLPPPLI